MYMIFLSSSKREEKTEFTTYIFPPFPWNIICTIFCQPAFTWGTGFSQSVVKSGCSIESHIDKMSTNPTQLRY